VIAGSDTVKASGKPPIDRSDDIARWALCAILAGMLALPMVPGWQGLTRLLAAYVLFHALSEAYSHRTVRIVFLGLGIGLLVFIASWVQSALDNPGRHLIGTLTDVYGLALPLYGGIALILVDLGLIAGLASLVARRNRHPAVRAGLAFATAFWLASLSGPLVLGTQGVADIPEIEQMLAGSSEWAVWVVLLGLCLVLLRTADHLRNLLAAIALGGLMMAAVVALQFAFSDFAYVLDAAQLQDYFYRARGTAYYHAPATYTLAIALMLILGFFHGTVQSFRGRWGLAGVSVALALLISLNDTRGLNLALVGGIGLFAAIMLLNRDWKALFLSLLVIAIVGSNMIYMKPAIGSAAQTADVSKALVERLSSDLNVLPKVEPPPELVEKAPILDGSLRLVLMQSGLRSMQDHLFIGSGVGTLDLVFSEGEGFVFSSTYSSHTLYIDMALMAGMPALVLFLALCGLAFLSGAVSSVSDWKQHRSSLTPGMMGALVVVGIGAVFLPQEMNNIVALFFVLSALLLAASFGLAKASAQMDGNSPSPIAGKRLVIGFTAVLGVAVIGWAVLTSPTYTLPVLNLVARHADEIERTQAEVYVSTPLAAPLARGLLRLRGVTDPTVRVLKDDPAALPQENAFIIWHPATDWRYPVLKETLPYRFIRPESTAPSVEFPLTWWMRKSVPYAGFVMQAGTREASELFDGLAADPTDMHPDLMLLPDVGRFIGIVKMYLPAPPKTLGSTGQQAQAETPKTPDALAEPAKKSTITFGVARNLTDANPATYQLWKADKRQAFYLDMGLVPPNPIAAYRFIPSPVTLAERETRMRWRLLGSDDLKSWTLLDSRATILGQDPEKAPAFAIPNPRFYRYLMFVFQGTPNSDGSSLLGDIEIFPSPQTLPKTSG
jgi:hypothetical protein